MNTNTAYLPLVGRRHPAPGWRGNAVTRHLVRWYRRQRAIAELRALSDNLLADIGIRRDEIDSAVDGLLERDNERLAAGRG